MSPTLAEGHHRLRADTGVGQSARHLHRGMHRVGDPICHSAMCSLPAHSGRVVVEGIASAALRPTSRNLPGPGRRAATSSAESGRDCIRGSMEGSPSSKRTSSASAFTAFGLLLRASHSGGHCRFPHHDQHPAGRLPDRPGRCPSGNGSGLDGRFPDPMRDLASSFPMPLPQVDLRGRACAPPPSPSPMPLPQGIGTVGPNPAASVPGRRAARPRARRSGHRSSHVPLATATGGRDPAQRWHDQVGDGGTRNVSGEQAPAPSRFTKPVRGPAALCRGAVPLHPRQPLQSCQESAVNGEVGPLSC